LAGTGGNLGVFLSGGKDKGLRLCSPSCHDLGNAVKRAEALFGGARASAGFDGAGASDAAFAMNIGGGLDWVAHKTFAVRVIQLDLLVNRFGPDASFDPRISTGIVFRLGSK
jgi:hypothetical protein